MFIVLLNKFHSLWLLHSPDFDGCFVITINSLVDCTNYNELVTLFTEDVSKSTNLYIFRVQWYNFASASIKRNYLEIVVVRFVPLKDPLLNSPVTFWNNSHNPERPVSVSTNLYKYFYCIVIIYNNISFYSWFVSFAAIKTKTIIYPDHCTCTTKSYFWIFKILKLIKIAIYDEMKNVYIFIFVIRKPS